MVLGGGELTISGKGTGQNMGAASWVNDEVIDLVLRVMMPENRLAVEVSLATGLRISDVLKMKTSEIERSPRPTVRDSKTGKRHRIYLPVELRREMLAIAGAVYVFEGRLDPQKHRTRSAVYKDMTHAAEVVKRARYISRQVQVSPHSARKVAAVHAYQRGGIAAAQALLVHDPEHPLVTLTYALADQMPPARRRARRRKKKGGADGA